MFTAAMLAATALLAATTPLHALPWYFGLAVFVVWATAAVGLGLLVRRRIKARAERRQASRNGRSGRSGRSGRAAPGMVRDDRSLGSGADIEPR